MEQLKKHLLSWKYPFIASMCAGFAAFLYAFTNKLPNWDDLRYVFSKGATLESGRFGLAVLEKLFPNYSMPWLWGLLSLLFFSLSFCMVLDILELQKPFVRVLLPAVLMVFPTQICLFAYMFTSAVYALAFLLAVSAVWCYQLDSGLRFRLLSILLLFFSLSIYQVSILFAAALFVLRLIKDTLETGKEISAIIKEGFAALAILLLSLALYLIVMLGVNRLCGVTFGAYAEDSLTEAYPFLRRIRACIAAVIGAFLPGKRFYALVSGDVSAVLHLLLFALCFALLLAHSRLLQKKGQLLRIALLWCLVLIIFPLSVSCILLLTYQGVHTLVLQSFMAFYCFMALICEKTEVKVQLARLAAVVLAAGLSLILWCNVLLANRSFLKLHYMFEYELSLCTQVYTQLQLQPGFRSDSTVALIGRPDMSPAAHQFDDIRIMGMAVENIPQIFRIYLGTEFSFADDRSVAQLAGEEEVRNMPSYPDNGYIQEINGVLVVKFH